ncbi:hypothetical protein DRE_04419 [Drechslerella stenobrocha 248]|uniref:Granulins domain-containing protein n=1 Tax=Drechslerella stenobrocha 248 TaxID=1043628 RepID=W7I1W9_9PEZI|nr:hypothetical protein DRE_04419 [Drechslerella stenobrocha 248]
MQTISRLLVLVSVAEVALAAQLQPFGVVQQPQGLAIFKRQSLCSGPVICSQTANSCRSCNAGQYCASGGGCCPVGEICAGFKPCVNAGTPAPTQTQVCPTDAPICTKSDGIPICSGSIQDWLTISEGLNVGASTTEPPESPTGVPTTRAAETSTPEPTTASEPGATDEPSTSVLLPTYSNPTRAPSATYSSIAPPAANTTGPAPPSATGAGARNQLGLGTAVGLVLFSVFLL